MNVEHRTSNFEIRTTHDARRTTHHEKGFSLTEVLLAVGTLAIGMLFIAGVFPVSIHFTTVAAERTIAATVADEAFAKIKLYGAPAGLVDTNQIPYVLSPVLFSEYAYPSIPTTDPALKRYWWSAVCRRVGPADVQVTVFVSRKAGAATKYYSRDVLPPFGLSAVDWPVPVFVSVSQIIGRPDELLINETPNFINDGYTIVDDATGNIYRVLERYPSTPNVIRLDRDWQGTLLSQRVWTVPASVSFLLSSTTTGRYPCIAVYQKVMRF